MKRTLIALGLLISISQYGNSQCNMNFSLSSQADVNAFPNCPTVTGTVTISGGTITDLSPLSSITTITGTLEITFTTSLTSLNGLDNLVSAAAVNINNNTMLNDISALDNTTVSNSLTIRQNAELSQCQAFGCALLMASIPSVTIESNNKATSGCDSAAEILATATCPVVGANVPTMGEWALICLSLLLMITGTLTLQQKGLSPQTLI